MNKVYCNRVHAFSNSDCDVCFHTISLAHNCRQCSANIVQVIIHVHTQADTGSQRDQQGAHEPHKDQISTAQQSELEELKRVMEQMVPK